MIQERLSALVAQVVGELGFSDIEVGLERPADEAHGDWSTNAAMVLWSKLQETRSKKQDINKDATNDQPSQAEVAEGKQEANNNQTLNSKSQTDSSVQGSVASSFAEASEDKSRLNDLGVKSPRGLGEKIRDEILKQVARDGRLKRIIEKVEVAGPGFVNFFLRDEYYLRELGRVVEDKRKTQNSKLKTTTENLKHEVDKGASSKRQDTDKSQTSNIENQKDEGEGAALDSSAAPQNDKQMDSEDLSDGDSIALLQNGGELKGKRVVVEYTDPNPFKEFHIGHLYSNVVGESIARLFEAGGARVWRADYFGDVGMHVAKALWGMIYKLQVTGDKEQAKKGQNARVRKQEANKDTSNKQPLYAEAAEGKQDVNSAQNTTNKLQIDEVEEWLEELGKKPLKERVELMGRAYALGATEYKDGGEKAKEEMRALNFLIFRAAQEVVLPEYGVEPQVDYQQFIKESRFGYEAVKRLYHVGRGWSLEYFEQIYERLGTKFDGYYPESLTGEFGYQIVMEWLEKGVFTRGEEGAIIYPGEKYGLHNRVFVNALGLPTYEAKELGNAVVKWKDFEYDISVVVTGNEIDEYFKVVLAAMKEVEPELGEKTRHVSHGMVRLPEGKMSSRTGKILKGEWLLDEAKAVVLEIYRQKGWMGEEGSRNSGGKQDGGEAQEVEKGWEDVSPLSAEEIEEVAEMVAQGAVKYALLRSNVGADVVFDFEESVNFEGNSGPYVQYTHARALSVLRKQQATSGKESGVWGDERLVKRLLGEGVEIELNEEERAVLRWLERFEETVARAADELAPHAVCGYVYELAQRFNSFYNKHSILNVEAESGKEQVMNFRLALTAGVAEVLKEGLGLLGIRAPERM